MVGYGQFGRPADDGSDTVELRRMAVARFGLGPLYDGPDRMAGMRTQWTDPASATFRDDGLLAAPAGYRTLPAIEEALYRWPAAPGVLALVDSWTPLLMAGEAGRGCCSGHTHPRQNEGRIHIFCTVEDPTGAAEGVVHEIAHQRLHVLGVDLEEHDGLLLDHAPRPDAVHFSPVRRDVPRPVTALLHGIYAWTFMLEVDLSAGPRDDWGYLSRNVPKVRDGLETLARAARWTAAGAAFFESFHGWAESLVKGGADVLKAAGVEETPYPGKEW